MSTSKRHLHELNPGIGKIGAGTKLSAFCEAHGERLITGTLDLTRQIASKDLPIPFGLSVYNTVHFPTTEVGSSKPLVHQLVQLITSNVSFGEVWAAEASLSFNESEVEEHTALQPKEIIGGYYISMGMTVEGVKVVHNY